MTEMNDAVQLNFVGDVSLGELFENIKHGVKSKILKNINPFEFCSKDFTEADLNVINLECVLSDTSDREKPFSEFLRAPENFANLLKANRIHIANLANNHTLDHGQNAYEKTVKILNSNGISTFGHNRNEWQEKPLIKKIKGISIGFLGYYIEETVKKEMFDEEILLIEKSLSATRSQVDKVVLSLHWGHEYTNYPMSWQIDLAKRLITKFDVDIIYGHHTHTLNGAVKYKNCIFAPSLGNFVFDEHYKNNRLTAILKVNFNKSRMKSAFVLEPFFVNTNFQPVPASGEQRKVEVLNSALSKLFNSDERQKRLLDKKNTRKSKIGHLKNRIKIRFYFLLRLKNYIPNLKYIIKFSKIKRNYRNIKKTR